MDAWFTWFRFGHIVAGAVALFIGPLDMATVKGGRWHRRWGKIYFWAMAAVAATVMCWLRSGLFLFLVAVFSFYLALTGYTVLRRKTAQARARMLDWVEPSLYRGREPERGLQRVIWAGWVIWCSSK